MDGWRALGAALSGIALALVAFMFDASPLLVPGIAFVLLGVAAPAWAWLSGRGVKVERTLQQQRVMEGELLEATLELSGGILGLPGGEVYDPLARGPMRLPRGRRATVRVLARFERRGRRQLAPPRVLVRDPLDLARCRKEDPGAVHEVLVLPRVDPVQWAEAAAAGAMSSAPRTRADLLAAVEIDGLRPYRHGTPASRIHWPALARGAGLLERRLRVDGETLPLVVLDAREPESEEDLDAAVRAAASLTFELARHGGSRLLLPGERRAFAVESDLISWPAAHARLALVEGGAGTRAPSPAGVRSAMGSLFYITARRLERLPAALGMTAASVTVLVLPASLSASAGARASLSVSGCRGFVLGLRYRGGPSRARLIRERTG
jgi:uncharacterized protein (DUF58 family)